MFKRQFIPSVCFLIYTFVCVPVYAYEPGDIILRGGIAQVDPDDDSSRMHSSNLGSVADTGVGVGSDTQLGITVTYMLTKNWGLELLAATPFTHDLKGEGATLRGLDLDGDIGEVEHLPPTLTVQYYFDTNSRVTPYLGAGINYTIMMEDSLNNKAKGILGTDSLDLENSTGFAWQMGIDIEISENLVFNVAVWNIDIDTEAKIDDSVLGDLEVDVDIDPWVYMVGVGYKF